MKITAKIAATMDNSISRFPIPGSSLEELVTPDGHFDEAAALKALSGIPGVQLGSGDEMPAIAFGIEILKQLERVVSKLVQDPNRDCRLESKTRSDRSCERKLDRGDCIYVTMRIGSLTPYMTADRRVIPSISVSLDVDNPRRMLAASENFATDFALLSAKIINFVINAMGSKIHVVRKSGEHIEGDIFELAERDERFWEKQKAELELIENLKNKRAKCSCRCGEYCSPSCPDCAMYLSGRCVEPVLSGKYDDDNRVKVELKK